MNPFFRSIEYTGIALLIGIAVFTATRGDFKDILVIMIATVVAAAPLLVKQRYGISVPPVLRASLVVFLFTTVILGETQNFYDTYWWWDFVLHSIAGFGLTIVATIVLAVANPRRRHPLTPLLMATFAYTIAITASVGWEFYEFFVDMIMGSNMQPSGDDTMWDLIGAATAALPAAYASFKWNQRHRSDGVITSVIDDGVKRNSDARV